MYCSVLHFTNTQGITKFHIHNVIRSILKSDHKANRLDWIKPFLKITIEGRAIYGNLENTLYWPVENSIPKNNDRR
jgi:hypothetical protein